MLFPDSAPLRLCARYLNQTTGRGEPDTDENESAVGRHAGRVVVNPQGF
jgi:hypothetical protein